MVFEFFDVSPLKTVLRLSVGKLLSHLATLTPRAHLTSLAALVGGGYMAFNYKMLQELLSYWHSLLWLCTSQAICRLKHCHVVAH